MRKYIYVRVFNSIVTILGLILFMFIVMQLAPGDFVTSISAMSSNMHETVNLRTSYGMNIPAELRAFEWFSNFIRGDWGVIYSMGNAPVLPVLLRSSVYTLIVVVSSAVIGLFFAILYSVISLNYQNKWQDYMVSFFVYTGNAVPEFWVALLCMVALIRLQGLDSPFAYPDYLYRGYPILHINALLPYMQWPILPILILSIKFRTIFTKYLRASMQENVKLDYIRCAYSKGLSKKQVYMQHLLPNSIIPMLSLMSLVLPEAFATCAVLEGVFRVQGLGNLMIMSAFSRDSNLLISLVCFVGTLSILLSILIDILYVKFDPRIRYD